MRAVRASHSASGLQQATKPRKSREHRLSFSKCDNDGNVIVVASRRKRKGTLAYGGIAKQASPREESSLSPKASPSTFAQSISLVSSLSAAFASGPSPLEGSPSLSVVNSASGESDSHSTDIWAHDTSPLYTHDAQGFEWPSSVTATPVRPQLQLSISDVLIGERSYSTPTSVLSQVSPQSPSLVGTPSSRVITQNDFVVRDSPLTRSRCDLTDTRVATRIHTKARLANSDTTTTLASFLFSVVTCDSLFPFLSFQRSIPRSGSICVYKNHVRSVTRIHASSGAKPLEVFKVLRSRTAAHAGTQRSTFQVPVMTDCLATPVRSSMCLWCSRRSSRHSTGAAWTCF